MPSASALAVLRAAASHNGTLFANGVSAHAVPFGSADSSLTVGCVGSDRAWCLAPNQVPRAKAAPAFDPALLLRSLGAVAPRLRQVLRRRQHETLAKSKLLRCCASTGYAQR